MARYHRIVVGVDFGTTYTAVCWADTSAPDKIELLSNWPTNGQIVGTQAPTEISYDEKGSSNYSWGYTIGPQARKVQWFKLGLETDQDVLTLPLNMSVVDVVHDFLAAIYKHTMTTLYRRFPQGVMQVTKVDFVLTVPAIWSDAAKSKVEDAASRAGMTNEHNLQLLSEPESAAVYTIKSLGEAYSPFKLNDRLLVCDAGGGTVDLIAYEIQQISPRLTVVECTAGTGDFCGSTFIDREFEKLFKTRLGAFYENVSYVNRQQTIKNFEGAKAAFGDDPDQKSFYVQIPTIGTIESARVYGGNFEITQDEMRGLFDPIIDQIIELISAQVAKVAESTYNVGTILLVGGFGESEYLYKRVSRWASARSIQVVQPRDAATSIVRGAVLRGLEPQSGPARTGIVRRARRSYGVAMKESFISGKHLEIDAVIDEPSGERLARNQVSWFIRKNQKLSDDETFQHQFSRTFRQLEPWNDRLVTCPLDVPPTRSDGTVMTLCSVTADLTHLNKRKSFPRKWHKFRPFYTARYAICLGVSDANLKFSTEFEGERYGVATVNFET